MSPARALLLLALVAPPLSLLADEPPKPAEGKPGEAKPEGEPQGKAGEGKPADGKPEAKPGEAKPGEAKPRKRRAALKEYLTSLEAQRETLELGELKLEVTALPDYFVHQMVGELLAQADLDERSTEALKEQVARLAERRKATMGKPALLVRFQHAAAGRRNFFGFEGQLDDCLRVRVDGKSHKISVATTQGDLPRARAYTLFKASRSGAYGGGNVPPTLRTTIQVLPPKPFTLHLLLAKPPGEKSKALELVAANLVHYTGAGITDDQMDFEKGASAEPVQPSKAEFPLPLRGPAMPPEVAELMPEWKGD